MGSRNILPHHILPIGNTVLPGFQNMTQLDQSRSSSSRRILVKFRVGDEHKLLSSKLLGQNMKAHLFIYMAAFAQPRFETLLSSAVRLSCEYCPKSLTPLVIKLCDIPPFQKEPDNVHVIPLDLNFANQKCSSSFSSLSVSIVKFCVQPPPEHPCFQLMSI